MKKMIVRALMNVVRYLDRRWGTGICQPEPTKVRDLFPTLRGQIKPIVFNSSMPDTRLYASGGLCAPLSREYEMLSKEYEVEDR